MEEIKVESEIVVTGRKPYLKPHIEIVSLRPKETVLGICKSISLNDNSGKGLDACDGFTTPCLSDDF
jgi:hypothetical protein